MPLEITRSLEKNKISKACLRKHLKILSGDEHGLGWIPSRGNSTREARAEPFTYPSVSRYSKEATPLSFTAELVYFISDFS